MSGVGSSKLFRLYRFGACHCIHLILVILLDLHGLIKLISDLAYGLITYDLYTLLLPSACRLDNGLLEVALVRNKGTMRSSYTVDIH